MILGGNGGDPVEVRVGVGAEGSWWCCCCGDLGHASRVRFFIHWLFHVRLQINYLLVV